MPPTLLSVPIVSATRSTCERTSIRESDVMRTKTARRVMNARWTEAYHLHVHNRLQSGAVRFCFVWGRGGWQAVLQ